MPDLIQTVHVPSRGLARQINYQSNVTRVQVTDNTRVQVTKNIKTKKCQPDAGDRPDLIQTATVPSTGLARQNVTLVDDIKYTQVIPFILSTVHTDHTLEPRVTDLVNVWPGQTVHTLAPRVTDLVPVGESLLSILQQSLFWSLTVVAVVMEAVKLTKVKSNDHVNKLSVASKLFTKRINLSKEINSPGSLSVANKVSEDTVKQPDDKWIKVVLTKTKKCQPDAGDMPDLIQTEHVPSTGLAPQNNKNKRNEKYKIKKTKLLAKSYPGGRYQVYSSHTVHTQYSPYRSYSRTESH